MRIEQIKRSKQQEQILITLEDGSVLRVTEDELLRFGLQKGMDLSPEDVVKCQKLGAQSRVRSQAAVLLGRRALSRGELTQRLLQKGAEEEAAEAAADWLTDIGAMNDSEYAAQIVRHYSRSAYGSRRIREELRRHQIPQDLWEDALREQLPAEECLRPWMEKRLKGQVPDGKERQRIANALLRRGFLWHEIQSILQEYAPSAEE